MDNISDHITYAEATFSATGKRLGIINEPPEDILTVMKITAEKLFEPVRAHFNSPLRIISFFRTPKLNKAVGGAINSQHMYGEAIDVQGMLRVTNAQIFNFLLQGTLSYDQIIWEFGNAEEPDWIHMSYTTVRKNRMQPLISKKIKGKTVYEPYK